MKAPAPWNKGKHLAPGQERIENEANTLEELYLLRDLEVEAERSEFRKFETWADDPVGFIRDILGEHVWTKQREIAEAVRDNRHVAVKSCHGAGKSFIASRLVAWWLSVHGPGEAFVITSAPTFQQVRAILWREISRAHKKGHLPGRTNQTEWHLGDEIVGFGRKPADYNEHAFQGIHARKVLIVLDEACGIPKNLWTAAEAIATNEGCRIFAIGNPDDPASEFANKTKNPNWHTIRIDAFDTPNFTNEAVPNNLRELLVNPEWVEERRQEWTEESPLWTSKVRGEFPDVSTDTIIPLSWAMRAVNRSRENTKDKDPDKPHRLGVDIARFGEDMSVIAERKGPRVRIRSRFAKQDTMTTTGHVVKALTETGAEVACVDVVGVGAGVVDRLIEMGKPTEEMNAGAGADDNSRFKNKRAEWWWSLREQLEADEVNLPDDDKLIGQITAVKYKVTSKGQIQVESKDDMKKRGMKSPDEADAVVLCTAEKMTLPPPEIF